ncbi:hypothetical protein RCL1_003935 [Eukaryota sp. TZLM3-RCL]
MHHRRSSSLLEHFASARRSGSSEKPLKITRTVASPPHSPQLSFTTLEPKHAISNTFFKPKPISVAKLQPLPSFYQNLLLIFDSICSVYIASQNKFNKSISFPTLQKTVQRLLSEKSVDFSLAHLRQLIFLSPSCFVLSLDGEGNVQVSSAIESTEWHAQKTIFSAILQKRMETAQIKYLQEQKQKSLKEAQFITSNSDIWDYDFYRTYQDEIPLAPLPQNNTTPSAPNQCDQLLSIIKEARDTEAQVVENARKGVLNFIPSELPSELDAVPKDLIALTLHRQQTLKFSSNPTTTSSLSTVEKRSLERAEKVKELLSSIVLADGLRSLLLKDAIVKLKSDSFLMYETDETILQDVLKIVEAAPNLSIRKNRIIIGGS